MVGNRKQRQWVVKASKELGLMPTTEGGREMKLDITHAIDDFHGNEHTLPVVALYDDVVQLYARTKTAFTPTLIVLYRGPSAHEHFFREEDVHDDPKLNRFYPDNRLDAMTRRRRQWAREDEQNFDDAAAQAANIQRAGGLVGIGGHGELQGLAYHWEMWACEIGGMTPPKVLQAATMDAPASSDSTKTSAVLPGEAGRPRSASGEPSREHPQHQHDSVRHEERRAV